MDSKQPHSVPDDAAGSEQPQLTDAVADDGIETLHGGGAVDEADLELPEH